MEKEPHLVEHLYRMLLNPSVVDLYARVRAQHAVVRPVIYTMRATFLVYNSCFRDAVIQLEWDPAWHHGAQIVFPPEVSSADEILATYRGSTTLLEEERVDLRKSLERLLVTRTVLRSALGLDAYPPLVVTAAPKDVEATAAMLGMGGAPAFLWDDNPRLAGDPRVVSIEPFVRLPEDRARALEAWLEAQLPARLLDEYLVEFMLGADDCDRVIERGPDGHIRYVIPRCERVAAWPLPATLAPGRAEAAVHAHAPRTPGRAGAGADGRDSPVTPRSADSEESTSRGCAPPQMRLSEPREAR
jgi:hypothetical protein